jgi:peptidyl-prolyl cis-trans isomerase D
MAVIGSIRKYSGLLIIIIGLALAGFVMQDFFRKSGQGKKAKEFGEVNGEKIGYRDFDAKVEEQLEQLKKQQKEGQALGSEKIYQVKQQVWNQMVRDIIMNEQFDDLGITVSTDELYDLVQGKEPHQYILQSFSNPKTKMLDRERLNQFLHNFDQLTPEVKQQWLSIEKAIKEERINRKYNSLVANAFYAPRAFLTRELNDRNRRANIKFIELPYTDINDKEAAVTEDDLKKAYDEHKQEFNLDEPIRAIDFVVFDILPSADDMKKATEDIMKIKAEFEKTDNKDIANFVNSNSDSKYDSTYMSKANLPAKIDSAIFSSTNKAKDEPAEKKEKKDKKQKKSKKADKKNKETEVKTAKTGVIIGPYIENSTYYLAKLVDMQERPDSMRAKHILISYQGSQGADQNVKRTKKQAKSTADSLLDILKKHPEQFEDLARSISNDPSAKEKGGDLGWFADGAMIYSFNQACINGKVGDRTVVESVFGYHVIEITGKKDPSEKARVAIIKRAIDPSSRTIQDIYARASRFTAENPTLQQFEISVSKQGLNKRSADYVREMDNNLSGLEQAREIVRWSFDEKTKVGGVKDFEIENRYVTAALKLVRKKGIPSLDEIKTEITAIARKDKKAEMLTKKINDAKGSGASIEQLASKLNTKIDTASSLTFFSSSLPGAGPEPKVIGTVFAMKKGELSQPVKGEKGVYVVKIDNVTEPPVNGDVRGEYMQEARTFMSRVNYELYISLLKGGEITDNRMLYY